MDLENYSVINASPETFVTTLEQMYESPKIEITAMRNTVVIKSQSKSKVGDAKVHIFTTTPSHVNRDNITLPVIYYLFKQYMETVVSMDTNVFKEYDFRSQVPDVIFSFVTREVRALLGFCKERALLNFTLFFTDDPTQNFLVLHCEEPSVYKLELVVGIDRSSAPGEPEQNMSPRSQMPATLSSQAPTLSQAGVPSTNDAIESLINLNQQNAGDLQHSPKHRRILESDDEDN